MLRHAIAAVCLATVSAVAQNGQPPASDPMAVSLAQKSVATLTGGAPISDVTLNANVISVIGSDYDTGTATLSAKGLSESRVDLNLSGGTRSDVRNSASGVPAGAWERNGGTATPYAFHNCLTDASWFFSALSSLTQTSNPSFVFKYIGPEQHGGLNTLHIQVFQSVTKPASLRHISTVDFYLDPVSSLPLATAFAVHPDFDAGTDIPIEVRFANYQTIRGVQVPFHVQQSLNGSVSLDLNVTSVALNAGLMDTLFTLQ